MNFLNTIPQNLADPQYVEGIPISIHRDWPVSLKMFIRNQLVVVFWRRWSIWNTFWLDFR
ncbi:hypothetical cytosolic protein [Syntrophus aciditrophicus SB]|uniref:Hypothetical cytosolic protein n=1 Tax=Syntrophus aciditrophicus (strain SB) TaxID=56780 RepID=Q2LRC7_SYNAS|nr:hypothetical cytosolic protein [Syntrophus aciditrophicus SB]